MKLKTEERRELIRLDEHKALLCVEISRLQRAVHEIEDKLKEQDPFTLLRVRLACLYIQHSSSGSYYQDDESALGMIKPKNAELLIFQNICITVLKEMESEAQYLGRK